MTASSVKILTLNSGSSSLKFAIYQVRPDERLLLSGKLERIGLAQGRIKISSAGQAALEENADLPDHAAAIGRVLDEIDKRHLADDLSAIGHRVVMGGPHHTAPQRITPDLLQELHALCRIDPPHLPAALKTIEAAGKFRPGIPQIACFDTAFHRTLPPVAQAYALPRALVERYGLIRYGFHGISYEYIVEELRRIDPAAAEGKLVIAHLGNGASMAAVHRGRSVETTMGFTPSGGLMMGSRPGDLDPGVLMHLLAERRMSGAELNRLIYQESGLLGVSEVSSDMQDLVREQDDNPHAKGAIALFCYQARKSLGALAAVLDGVETVVFTGGIGENSSTVRAGICENLLHLGLRIDPAKNAGQSAVISTAESRVTVRVMKTNEELMIARHSGKFLTV